MKLIRKIFNSRSKPKDGDFSIFIQDILGFKPKDISFYETAFTHRSLGLRNTIGDPENYERLEFLGDSMLSSVIASYLYKEVPSGNEGYLTKMRSKVVSRKHLNELGKDLKLINHVRTQIPPEQFGINIHGNIFEALVGAIYLDRGYEFCEKFIYSAVIGPYIDIESLEGQVISYKSLLIEWFQKKKHNFKYEVYEDDGMEELRHFAVKLWVNDKVIAKARATSKKKAEEKVSKRAYFAFQEKIEK
ncbi:ribonuclease III [Aquimarina agarivorans]|uniref:ribonuclease III n=1 Tax=Aquimarina agarivorans TaxID=980584 RepID=UPI000248EF77|nr:ribonuclease III [Aquimarina agarivorans]